MKRIAISNLKGGVGKSTTSLFVSECLAHNHGLRVLIVDLDPQSNCSFMLMGREGVEIAEEYGRTLLHFLLDKNKQNISNFITVGASDLAELRLPDSSGIVDILPSIPRMWFVESELTEGFLKSEMDPVEEIRKIFEIGMSQISSAYDVVIIDCPPGFSTFTRTGLLISDAIISPTLADEVSVRSLKDFVEIGLGNILKIKNRENHHVIVSKFISNRRTKAIRDFLRREYDVLEPSIGYAVAIMDALSSIGPGSTRTFKQKYDRKANEVSKLSDEIYRFLYKITEATNE